MNEEEYIELINAELDGELDAEQSIELEKLLQSCAQAREYRNDLNQMNKMFSELPDVDVPNSFQVAIADSSYSQNYNWISKIFQWPVEFKVTMATACLLIVLLSLNQITVNNSTIDTRALVGTIVKDSFPISDNNSDGLEYFSYPWLNGSAKLNKTDELYLVTVELNSQDPVTVKIDYSENGMNFVGFAQLKDGIDTVYTGEGILHFTHQGENGFTVFLKPEHQKVKKDLQISYTIFSNKEKSHIGNLKFK